MILFKVNKMSRFNLLLIKSNQAYHLRSMSSNVKKKGSLTYCIDLIRKHDYENFLPTLLLPKSIRSAGIAIRAFNVEVALVEDQVSEKKIGEMRLKFWEEAVNEIYNGNPPRNPVGIELYRALQSRSLSKSFFKRLITARVDRLKGVYFENMQDVERYAENSVTPIYYLLLEAHGVKDISTDHVASHLGRAQGTVTFLKSIPYYYSKGQQILPRSLLAKHKVSSEAIMRQEAGDDFYHLLGDVAWHAEENLKTAFKLKKDLKRDVSTIFLPMFALDKYLKNLKQVNYNVFHKSMRKPSFSLPFELYLRKIFRLT